MIVTERDLDSGGAISLIICCCRRGTLWLICLLIALAGAIPSSLRAQAGESKRKEGSLAPNNGSTDSAVTDRLRRAVLVVKGRVVSIHPLEQARPGPRSEHNPEWWQASVEVAEIYKGQSKDKVITVLFPNSSDIAWYKSHKFKPGEEGFFVLETQPAAEYRIQGFTALDPLDFQPLSEQDRVRQLLRAIH
jgi:hypothetical protein